MLPLPLQVYKRGLKVCSLLPAELGSLFEPHDKQRLIEQAAVDWETFPVVSHSQSRTLTRERCFSRQGEPKIDGSGGTECFPFRYDPCG